MLEELRKLEAAATPGPWRTWRTPNSTQPGPYIGRDISPSGVQVVPAYPNHEADSSLIAAMRNALPALLDVAEAAQLIKVYEDAGGNEWWEAHAKLYAALARLQVQSPPAQGAEQRPETGAE